MDKKIGILALGRAENYGAVLQNYSLCRFVRKYFEDCEVIDYTPEFIIGKHPLFKPQVTSLKGFVRSFVGESIRFPARIMRKEKFEKFRKNKVHFSNKKYFTDIDDDYTKYIVGSDQVFNLELTNGDVNFFLPKVKSEHKKITYAASLGVSKLKKNEEELLERYLPTFEEISIRENLGKQIVENIIPDKVIYQHIDPVFLTPKDEWEEILDKNHKTEPYVLIYAFQNFDLAYELAKRTNAGRILYINDDFKKVRHDVQNIGGVGPIDFLQLIHDANYVITDSFHGTAFSVIFERRFVSIPYLGTESRFYSLLSTFGLENRIYNSNNKLDMESRIDYKRIKKIITLEVNKSYLYLKNSLSE